MRPRNLLIAVVLALSIVASLTSCQAGRNYSNPETGKAHTSEPPEMISQGIKADYRIANELNKIPGLQGAAVLIKDGHAYVGTHVIGQEKNPDAYMKKKSFGGTQTPAGTPGGEPGTMGQMGQPAQSGRSLLSGKGVPKTDTQSADTRQNGITQFGQDMQEYTKQSGDAAVPGKTATSTGNIDPQLIKQIEMSVKSMAPGIQHVYITANNENVGQIQGYARYIQDGGSMDKFMRDFEKTIRRIWPNSSRS